MVDLALIASGVLLLYAGGELLVRSVSSLALAFNVRPLVIGLTVVAFGTSAPELAAALTAALRDAPDVAVGNIVGSNIANLGLILGLAVIVQPLRAEASFIRRELPFMLGTSALVIPFVWTGVLNWLAGSVFLILFGIYLWILLQKGEVEAVRKEFVEELAETRGARLRGLVGSLAGLALLFAGAEVLVRGAVGLALDFGVAERVVGLTVVAFGTSLPEMAGCLVAAAKRQGDIVLGNIIGSNIFNVLLVLALTVLVRPIAVSLVELAVDLGVMMALSIAVLLVFGRRHQLNRLEGSTLLVAYLTYIAYLFWTQAAHGRYIEVIAQAPVGA